MGRWLALCSSCQVNLMERSVGPGLLRLIRSQELTVPGTPTRSGVTTLRVTQKHLTCTALSLRLLSLIRVFPFTESGARMASGVSVMSVVTHNTAVVFAEHLLRKVVCLSSSHCHTTWINLKVSLKER